MDLESRDRLHAKQGRSTARVIFHAPTGPLSVYLKRHFESPWPARLGALIYPRESILPPRRNGSTSNGCEASASQFPRSSRPASRSALGNLEELPDDCRVDRLPRPQRSHARPGGRPLAREPRRLEARVITEMARIVATLHGANVFHKDLYLCHFFVDLERPPGEAPSLTLIDLHRTQEHRLWPDRWHAEGPRATPILDARGAGIDDPRHLEILEDLPPQAQTAAARLAGSDDPA